LIYSVKKKKKKKRNDSFFASKEKKKSYKLPYMEDFKVNVEISEEKILFKLKCTRKE
jgi:hypothetical protein